MNEIEKKYSAIDASCRVPLLVLFGVASFWLIAGLALAIIASLTFHNPEMFANCPILTYGRVQPAANDAILYGFAIPAALGVMLWIFARLSESELLLPLVAVVAANIWLLGVLIGVVAILIGDSTGFTWLEFPRAGSVLLFAAFLLIAISAAATFGARRERMLEPAHWFLLAALFWFPWIYSTANMFLIGAWPVRGVAQAVIAWWFSNNLIFVWLALVGLGVAFYLLPKIAQRPLQSRYFALFGFWTFILFAPWLGIPQSAPVPAWLTTASAVASLLTVVPLIAITIVFVNTIRGVNVQCKGGPYCYARIATILFILSALMLLATGHPCVGNALAMTWYMPAQMYLQILGFFAIVICGAVYESLSGVMGFELPFPGFVRWQNRFFLGGLVFLVLPLAIGGIEQGIKMQNPAISWHEISHGTLNYLRVSTVGFLFLLLGGLLFALNIFVMTTMWLKRSSKLMAESFAGSFEAEEVKS